MNWIYVYINNSRASWKPPSVGWLVLPSPSLCKIEKYYPSFQVYPLTGLHFLCATFLYFLSPLFLVENLRSLNVSASLRSFVPPVVLLWYLVLSLPFPLFEPLSELCTVWRVLFSLLIHRTSVLPVCSSCETHASWLHHVHSWPYCLFPKGTPSVFAYTGQWCDALPILQLLWIPLSLIPHNQPN